MRNSTFRLEGGLQFGAFLSFFQFLCNNARHLLMMINHMPKFVALYLRVFI